MYSFTKHVLILWFKTFGPHTHTHTHTYLYSLPYGDPH